MKLNPHGHELEVREDVLSAALGLVPQVSPTLINLPRNASPFSGLLSPFSGQGGGGVHRFLSLLLAQFTMEPCLPRPP